MPGKPDKPHRIRVRVLDGKPREFNKLKGQLVPHVDVVDVAAKVEFVICASKERHLEEVRGKLGGAGLEEISGGDTTIAAAASGRLMNAPTQRRGGPGDRGAPPHDAGQIRQHPQRGAAPGNAPLLPGKPYGFVPLPAELNSAAPIWLDGTNSAGRHSGEVRFELETLTPLLVGWERGVVGVDGGEWPVPHTLDGAGQLVAGKPVLCPLRAPWGKRPVIIPGDSLKGLLRHELGALLGAPMERVAERSYSYRPNSMFAPGAQLAPRIARVPNNGVKMVKLLDDEHQVRVPVRLELLPTNLKYDKNRREASNYYRFDDGNGAPYRGGLGAGKRLNSTRRLHETLTVNASATGEFFDVPLAAQEGYLATLRHLVDLDHGHFSGRHPDVPKKVRGEAARQRILAAAASVVFQPGDLIWVEWDIQANRIVSLGWHYYYRWAYADSIRETHGELGKHERAGLFPLLDERLGDADGAPTALSLVRRIFGYTGDNEGSKGIGKEDHAQLMGRISVNAGLEVVADGDSDEARFLPPTFLKELGMPRPSAVEYYLEQPHHPRPRPSDQATLVTYGDAVDYDAPGKLAGRKFYLDSSDAYTGEPWKDADPGNERSSLALEASCPRRRFRFTVRFRDLDTTELAAILVAFCPHQFRAALGGKHDDGYCSKLGYARPLGWGTVRVEAKSLLLLEVADGADGAPALHSVSDIHAWVATNHQQTATQTQWLAVHRQKHPDWDDYPRDKDRDGNLNIYTFHTNLRARHSRLRRYRGEQP